MLFSILIAHYNNFNYFKDCYQSILNQSIKDIEIVILDDCSKEDEYRGIMEIVKNDERVKVFRNEENKGVGFTKNKLIELASGDICGFLDPDDALFPTAIEKSLAAYKNPDIIATYSQFSFCNQELTPTSVFKNSSKITAFNPLFFNINFEVAHFFTFKKEAYLLTSGINKELRLAEDQDLYLKLYEKGVFQFINEPLYQYRKHDKGVSQNQTEKQKNKYSFHSVLKDTLIRRKIATLYGKDINDIDNLHEYIFKKQNSLFCKIRKKIRKNFNL